MQAELEKLIKLTARDLQFNDQQIAYMHDNIGNLDPYLRDDLVYSLYVRGFMEKGFNKQQQELIVSDFLQDKSLFKKINDSQNNAVFLRSFSALLGAIILEKDNKDNILTSKQRLKIFSWSVKYLKEEKDYRGYVNTKGWAHSVAHGSDFLGAYLNHKKFQPDNVGDIFEVIPTILTNIKTPFIDEEEARLAYAFYQGRKVT